MRRIAKLRIIDPFGLYHITTRGNYRREIFVNEEHAGYFLKLVSRIVRKRAWIVLDWCLMPNHYHLVIRLQDGGLSDGMRELNGCFSRWTNGVHERTGTGHLVKNRFGSTEIVRHEHLLEVCRYVPLNPVAAGLVSRPEDWPWSGFRAAMGLEHPRDFHRPDHVLRLFHDEPAEARRRYRDLVSAGLVRLALLRGLTTGVGGPPPASA